MSKNRILLIIAVFFGIGLSVFYSCTKIEHSDEAPKIESVDSPVVNQKIYLDSFSIFQATFSDNKSLSSYSVKIWDPTLQDVPLVKNPDNNDSLAIINTNIQKVSIFGKTFAEVKHDFNLPSVQVVRGKQYKVRTGTYRIRVILANTFGNADSVEYNIQVMPAIVNNTQPSGQ